MNHPTTRSLWPGLLALLLLAAPAAARAADGPPLAGTDPLTIPGDLASNLVAGVDRFLLRQIEESVAKRAAFWKRDFASPEAYQRSVETNRQRLAHITGARDARVSPPRLELIATPDGPALQGQSDAFEIHAVRWPAFGDVHGEGLLLTPRGRVPVARVIAIPDAAQTPEQIAGLEEGVAPESQFARRLAESGCQVLIPTVIDRDMGPHKGRARLTAREFLHRSAFELGRHLIGYEVQKVLAGVDWFSRPLDSTNSAKTKIGVIGWGEGGLLALHAGALDPRIDAVAVSGYFDDRSQLWREPIDRNVFGLFEQFGDAEIASLIAPRPLVIEAARGPEITVTGVGGGAPARLLTPALGAVRDEFSRAQDLVAGFETPPPLDLLTSGSDGTGPMGSTEALARFLAGLAPDAPVAPSGGGAPPTRIGARIDPQQRQARQLHEIDRHNQKLLTESPLVRQEFMKNLNTKSPELFASSSEPYRKFFHEEVIGRFDQPPLPPRPRSRRIYENPRWTGYEVVLDVFPDVIAYGILLLPTDLKPGERRPVVVCQHGLEGRPQNIITGDHHAPTKPSPPTSPSAGSSPSRPTISTSRRTASATLQRKRNLHRHRRSSRPSSPSTSRSSNGWRRSPSSTPTRIAFYGLSYGGKSAMRIPPLVPEYVLSICSADFNEWVAKNAATAGTMGRYSYVWSGEYEIFEWDLGGTFNYAEMAALIAPRPFMVERGHFDGVAPDEAVGYEFGKVEFLYAARLGIGDLCELETFVGPHTINGKGTFDFLHKHLQWPKPATSP